MADNLEKRQPQDGSKVSLSEDWELRYWCKKLGVSEKELRSAVKEVGNSSEKVKKYLSK